MPGADCSKSMCCDDPNSKCYQKNDHWASCKRSCTEGETDGHDEHGWTCKILSKHNLECAHEPEDCIMSGCCVDDSKTCYQKDDWYAGCRDTGTCTAGEPYEHDVDPWKTPWTCKDVV